MPNGTYGGVRGRRTKVGRKLLRFPPTRFTNSLDYSYYLVVLKSDFSACLNPSPPQFLNLL